MVLVILLDMLEINQKLLQCKIIKLVLLVLLMKYMLVIVSEDFLLVIVILK